MLGRTHLYITGKIGKGLVGVVVDAPGNPTQTWQFAFHTYQIHNSSHPSVLTSGCPVRNFEAEKGQPITSPTSRM